MLTVRSFSRHLDVFRSQRGMPLLFESIIFRNSTVTFRSTSLLKMQNRHTLTQFFSQPEMHVFPSFVFPPKCFFLMPAKSSWQKMTLLLKLFPSVRRKVMHLETTCFRFPCSESPPWKTGKTGAEMVSGRTHPMPHGVYPLHRLLEDNSLKSYREDKAHRNSTNNMRSQQWNNARPRLTVSGRSLRSRR